MYKVSRSGNIIIIRPDSVLKILLFPKNTSQGVKVNNDICHPSFVEYFFVETISDLNYSNNPNNQNNANYPIFIKCLQSKLVINNQIETTLKKYDLDDNVHSIIRNKLQSDDYYQKIAILEIEKGEMNLQEFLMQNVNDPDIDQILKEYLLQIFYQILILQTNIPGFVHGDLKPNNIILAKDPQYKEGENRIRCLNILGLDYYVQIRPLVPKLWDFEFSKSNRTKNRLYESIYLGTEENLDNKIDIYRFLVYLLYDIKTQITSDSNDVHNFESKNTNAVDYDDVISPGTIIIKKANIKTFHKKCYVDKITLLSELIMNISIKPRGSGVLRSPDMIDFDYLDFLKCDTFSSLRINSAIPVSIIKEPKKSRRCVVFDFDCTLTTVHTSLAEMGLLSFDKDLDYQTIIQGLKSDSYDRFVIIDKFFGGLQRLIDLTNMFNDIRSQSIDIHIASRGECCIIEKILEIIGLRQLINQIDANGSSSITVSKDIYIRMLLDRYEKIVYVDDDHGEYYLLNNYLKGITVDEDRIDVKNNPINYRQESASGFIETCQGDSTLIFMTSLKLFAFCNQDLEARGLTKYQMDQIIRLIK